METSPSSLQLTKKDHHQIIKYLDDLENDDLIYVGVQLGLDYIR